jgi:hypothetical protein
MAIRPAERKRDSFGWLKIKVKVVAAAAAAAAAAAVQPHVRYCINVNQSFRETRGSCSTRSDLCVRVRMCDHKLFRTERMQCRLRIIEQISTLDY